MEARSATPASSSERVLKSQALKPLDWLFVLQPIIHLNVSCDNLDGIFEPDRYQFQGNKVDRAALAYLSSAIKISRRAIAIYQRVYMVLV